MKKIDRLATEIHKELIKTVPQLQRYAYGPVRPAAYQPNDEEAKKREAEAAMRQRVLQVVLDPEARQRLMNIRLVKPDLAADALKTISLTRRLQVG